MNEDEVTLVLDVARCASRSWKRKNWWLEVEELEQELCQHLPKAVRAFDPRVGVPLRAYLMRAATTHLWKEVWSRSSPASSRSKKGNLRGTRRWPIKGHSVPRNPERDPGVDLADDVSPESRLDAEVMAARIRKTVRQVVPETDAVTQAAIDRLCGDTMRLVCRVHAVDSTVVRSKVVELSSRLRRSPQMWQLMKEVLR